jgi:hypothetical protein
VTTTPSGPDWTAHSSTFVAVGWGAAAPAASASACAVAAAAATAAAPLSGLFGAAAGTGWFAQPARARVASAARIQREWGAPFTFRNGMSRRRPG